MFNPFFFAANSVEDLRTVGPEGDAHLHGGSDILIIISVALALSVILFFWVYLRRPGRTTLISRPGINSPEDKEQAEKRRARHRGRPKPPLTRNPTLAETGGLPPPKDNPPS